MASSRGIPRIKDTEARVQLLFCSGRTALSTVFQLYLGLDVISLTTAKTRDQVYYSDRQGAKVKRLPEPACRPRYISRDQAERLMTELPEHLAARVRVSLATGLRQRNVVELEWPQVDMDRRCAWIFADQAKGARGIAVALNSEARSPA